jgi:penicillin-binding protein 2
MKPYVAIGALSENIIDPKKQILSTGSISVPNPYDKTKKTVFNDWKAHGWVDMKRAIAVSSNVYFFEVGGGFENQKGLGITNIEKYLRLFGFGSATGINIGDEETGTIPNPAWKAEYFDGEEWRVGDTYNTAIGQYGMQVTPIQVVRAVTALANNGTLLKPTIFNDPNDTFSEKLPLKEDYFEIIREGMREGVAGGGTAQALNIPEVNVAAKTGTAELGSEKRSVNSWVTGFFPYENPRYAFIVQMESGPRANLTGATFVMRSLFEWMALNTPEYIKFE